VHRDQGLKIRGGKQAINGGQSGEGVHAFTRTGQKEGGAILAGFAGIEESHYVE
jgi:hypothetical protein